MGRGKVKDLYFELLEVAEKKGLYNMVDVSKIMKRYLKDSPYIEMKPERWDLVPYTMLEPLIKKEYINCILGEQNVLSPVPNNWIDKLHIFICIMPEGILFLFEKRKIQQQIWTNRLTFGFIVVTFLIGLGTLYYSSQTLKITIANAAYKADSTRLNTLLHQQSTQLLKLRQDSIKMARLFHKYKQKYR